jgi:hypothetical protein
VTRFRIASFAPPRHLRGPSASPTLTPPARGAVERRARRSLSTPRKSRAGSSTVTVASAIVEMAERAWPFIT